MTDLLLTSLATNNGRARAAELNTAQGALKQMVLDSVTSPHTRRNYAKALDNLFFYPANSWQRTVYLVSSTEGHDHGQPEVSDPIEDPHPVLADTFSEIPPVTYYNRPPHGPATYVESFRGDDEV